MLFGTRSVSDFSFASTSSTAENQRLKLSELICGLSAADNCCHNWVQFLSIAELLTVLHNRHSRCYWGKSSEENRAALTRLPCHSTGEKRKKRGKSAQIRGKRALVALRGSVAGIQADSSRPWSFREVFRLVHSRC